MNEKQTKRVIALGFFDGVHLGHAALLRRAVELARLQDASAAALTFDNHPEALILGQDFPLINTMSERAEIMRHQYGIEEIIFAHFDESLMHTLWDAFISGMLRDQFGAVHVVAGYDFHFGFKGEGNVKRLSAECTRLGIGCDIIDAVEIDGITVSSTYIRKLIAQGDVERARQFLGHPHFVTGNVVQGTRIGTSKVGVPTANLPMTEGLQPLKHGVYVTGIWIENEFYNSVTNVGTRPTVSGGHELIVETSVFNFSGDLYGKPVRVEFFKYLRPETVFASIDELKAQIKLDVKEAQKYHKAKNK